ncbi:MAG: hypothetical protein ACYDA0_16095 [Candidatus Dormibacteraceae bacterium]
MKISDREAAGLDAMIEEATVDCHDEAEQAMGLFTMIQDSLALPFETSVLGVTVSVDGVDMHERGQIVAVCVPNQIRQAIPVIDLPLPTPAPSGAERIAAYRRWLGEGQ